MKIDARMIEQAYLTAKRVSDDSDDIGLNEGADFLTEKCNMNNASALYYIHAFCHMKTGEKYQRTINADATKYYLEHIFNDYGYDGLQTALQSVKLHIDYYESKSQVPSKAIQKVYDDFKEIPKPENVYNDYNDENEEYYSEGKAIQVLKNIYERDKDARRKCIEHYGHKCSVCGLILSDMYGEIAEDFIHVHHIIELSSIKKEYVVDPIKDLRPLCPNCHAIIHRKSPALSIEALIDIISNKKNKTAAKPTPPAGSPAA